MKKKSRPVLCFGALPHRRHNFLFIRFALQSIYSLGKLMIDPSFAQLQAFTRSANYHRGLHVAIIMDGNGRWATQRGLPRFAGHRAGIASVRRVVERALDHGIAQLTLYAFSSDNWRRPKEEVQ